jgi:hypothetical protein
MKTFICIAAALLTAAFFGDEARALTSSQAWAKPAAQQAAKPASETVKIRHRRRSGAFGNWCAYNCYAVPRWRNRRCLGRYGYSHYAYDEDLPFRYRWDRDASPIDNVDAFAYRFTGQPFMGAFERVY